MKAVHFGPGNIGRGLIGWMLSRSGYEVCFVSRNEKQIALMNRKKQYSVTSGGNHSDVEVVSNIHAIHLKNIQAVEEQIADASLVTTAVGATSLSSIARTIAKGIERRLQSNTSYLNIIACENAVNGSARLEKLVYDHLDPRWHEEAKEKIAFPNTLIDRIVPEQTDRKTLDVHVEPYFEWIIERSPFKGELPLIADAQFVDSLQPYLERKLFTVNTGHCCAAYYGYLEGISTIQEVMSEPRLSHQVQRVLEETSQLLVKKHKFNEKAHQEYVHKTINRFSTSTIVDKVVRVGRSPLRKLAMNERLVQPALQASSLGINVPYLISAMAAALLFNHKNDSEAVVLQAAIQQKGVSHVIKRHMGIPAEHILHDQLRISYESMKGYVVN